MKKISINATKDDLTKLYHEDNLPVKTIAQRFNVGSTTMFRLFAKLGIDRRKVGQPKENRPSNEELRKLYVDDLLGSSELSKMFDCHFVTILKWLREANVTIRNTSEAQKVCMSKRTYEEKLKFSEASRNTEGFKKQSPEKRIKYANTMQKNCKLSKYEKIFLDELNKNGIETIPQYAIYIFNIDFAIPDLKLAIEVDGGNWHSTSKKKIESDTKKEKYLSKIGWIVLRIKTRNKNWLSEGINKVKSYLTSSA